MFRDELSKAGLTQARRRLGVVWAHPATCGPQRHRPKVVL